MYWTYLLYHKYILTIITLYRTIHLQGLEKRITIFPEGFCSLSLSPEVRWFYLCKCQITTTQHKCFHWLICLMHNTGCKMRFFLRMAYFEMWCFRASLNGHWASFGEISSQAPMNKKHLTFAFVWTWSFFSLFQLARI